MPMLDGGVGGAAAVYLKPEFTYTICKDGATYKAINNQTNVVEFSSADCHVLVNDYVYPAIATLGSGSVLFKGATLYEVYGLNPPSYSRTSGEPGAKLKYPAGRYDDQGHSGYEENNIFYIESKTQVEIDHLELDGNQSAYTRYYIAPYNNGNAVRMYLTTHSSVHDCYIHDTRRSAVLVRGEYHLYTPIWVEVYNCFMENCNWDGPEFADCTDCKAYNLWITGTSDVCFAVWEGKRITFENIIGWNGNRALGSTNGKNCMSFDGNVAADYPNSEIIMKNCHFEHFDGEGILILNGTNNSRMKDCTFTNIEKAAIWCNGTKVRKFTVQGCTFKLCGETGGWILFFHGTAGTSKNLKLIENTIDNEGSSVTNTIGLDIANFPDSEIKDNTIKNVQNKGISLEACTGILFEGNTVETIGWQTFKIQGVVSRLTISHNFMYTGLDYVFKIDGAGTYSNWLIEGNHFAWTSAFADGTIPTDTKMKNNRGFVNENYGTATGTGAEQAISHGLNATPTLILLTEYNTGLAIPYQSSAAASDHIHVFAVSGKTFTWYVAVYV